VNRGTESTKEMGDPKNLKKVFGKGGGLGISGGEGSLQIAGEGGRGKVGGQTAAEYKGLFGDVAEGVWISPKKGRLFFY